MARFEILFSDLVPEAQERLLSVFETTHEEENWQIIPLSIIEREIEPE